MPNAMPLSNDGAMSFHGDIEYKGMPTQKDVRIFGSGDVDQYADDI